MTQEPAIKRAVCFFDGQNLFHHAKAAFGFSYPNFCPLTLAARICQDHGFHLQEIRFYTGVPTNEDSPLWHQFWSARLLAMSRRGIKTFARPLRRREKTFSLGQGIEISRYVQEEKGIDVRIAIDVMRLVRLNQLDVAVLFSQDQDFSEVADEIRDVAQEQGRWIKIVSAFPDSSTASNHRGINQTDWIRIDRDLYEACVDPRDYRVK